MAKKRILDDACPFPPGVDMPRSRLSTPRLNPLHQIRALDLRKVALLGAVILFVTLGASYVQWINLLNSGLPLEPSIITDKEQYHVGETIHATLRFYNPNTHSVSFNPPKTVYEYAHSWPDTIPDSKKTPNESPGTIEFNQIVQTLPWAVVAGDSYYTVVEVDFPALRVGGEMLHLGGLTKLVEIVE